MKKASLLLNPVFLFSLLTLIFNDFYLKYSYGNWLTGKLSDFAGLIVITIVCRIIFPRSSNTRLTICIGLFFIWWKSLLSQPLIDLLNQWHLPLERAVDYTDLFALTILPFALKQEPQAIHLNAMVLRGLQWTIGSFTAFAICATSLPYRSLFQAQANIDEIYFHESFTKKSSLHVVLENLARKGIIYRQDSIIYYPVNNQHQLYYRNYQKADSSSQWQPISQVPDSMLYIKCEGRLYYLIPSFTIDKKNLRNIRFTLSENKKRTKTTITIETFQAEGIRSESYLDNQTKQDFKKLFQQLFQ